MCRKVVNISSQCKQSGLTLVELLVAITILSIIMSLTFSVLFNVQKTQRKLDAKHTYEAEAARVVEEMETSLRFAQKLISGTERKVQFLSITSDTNEYYRKGDTFFKNQNPFTDLCLDSLYFEYIKIKDMEQITDFYILDEDRDGILNDYELRGVVGLNVFIHFLYPVSESTRTVKIKKEFSILLRNLQSE